jgi:hypothetical protein
MHRWGALRDRPGRPWEAGDGATGERVAGEAEGEGAVGEGVLDERVVDEALHDAAVGEAVAGETEGSTLGSRPRGLCSPLWMSYASCLANRKRTPCWKGMGLCGRAVATHGACWQSSGGPRTPCGAWRLATGWSTFSSGSRSRMQIV